MAEESGQYAYRPLKRGCVAMNLKNILIVVSDIDRSKRFYHDLFGLQVMRDFGDNVMLRDPDGHLIEVAER